MPVLHSSMALLVASSLAAGPPPRPAAGSCAVIAVARPPAGPDAALAEMANQLRATLRERTEEVLDLRETKARLLGTAPAGSLTELARAHRGAETAFEAGDFDRAAHTLRAVLDGLERLPESPEAYALQTRATVRLAYTERVRSRPGAAAQLLERLAITDPGFTVDAVQFPPSLRQAFEEARGRVAARPRTTLTVASTGSPAAVVVNGRMVGKTPVSLRLPPGRYRIGGASDTVRAPSTWVQLGTIDLAHDLDLGLSEVLRADAGPGLALEPGERPAAVARAGTRLGVSRVAVVSLVAERGSPLLEGALHDVRSGTVIRLGRVRLASGSASSRDLDALARYLLAGHISPEVMLVATTPPPSATLPLAGASALPRHLQVEGLTTPSLPTPLLRPELTARSSRGWMRPAAYAAGAVALGLAGVAGWQAVSSRQGFGAADAMLGPTGTLLPTADPATYARTHSAAAASGRNAYLCAAGAAAFAVTAGILGYLSRNEQGEPVVRF